MLPEVVFALVVVSIVGTFEPSSKVKSGLHEDAQKGKQALNTRIDALLHTVLNTCDKTPPVSEEELDAELARFSVQAACVEPSSAHSEGTGLEIQTELSDCSDVPSEDWPEFYSPVYSSDDSDSESFTPESTLFASQAYSEQSFASNQSTLESTHFASEVDSKQGFTSNKSTPESSLVRVCSTVSSFDPDDECE